MFGANSSQVIDAAGGDGVTFVPNYADLLAANRLIYRPNARRRLLYYTLIVIGLFDIAIALTGSPDGRMLPLSVGALLILVGPVWQLSLQVWLLPRYTRRHYGQAAILREAFTVLWSEAGLASRTSLTTGLTPWGNYIAHRQDDTTLLFLQTDAMFQFIPKRVLDAAQLDRLMTLAHAVPDRPWVRLWPLIG